MTKREKAVRTVFQILGQYEKAQWRKPLTKLKKPVRLLLEKASCHDLLVNPTKLNTNW